MNGIVRWSALSVVLFALCAVRAGAQELPTERRKALLEGTHVFRRILFDHRCTPLDDFDDLAHDPKRSILVLLGPLDRVVEVPGGLEKFVKDGGAVLLASDRVIRNKSAWAQIDSTIGATINDTTVISFETSYKGLSYCPVVHPVDGASQLFSDPNRFSDRVALGQLPGPASLTVVTNTPAHLRPRRLKGTVSVLAKLNGDCVYEQPIRGQYQPVDFNGAPFLVGGDVGNGRVLMAADHSLFINEMMLPDDTNNVEFSYNCIRYLRGGQPRDRVLFVDEGGIQRKFEIPLKSANLTPEEVAELVFSRRNQLLITAESELARLEDSNAHNALAARLLHPIDDAPGKLFAVLALFASLALLIYGMFRLGVFARFQHDRTTPTLAGALGRNLPAAPLVEQRNHSMLRLGNLNEPAGALARRWLLAQGVAVTESDKLAFRVPGGWWSGGKLRRRLRRVWLLAVGRSRETIEPAGLWRLQRELDALEQARQRGEWSA